MVSPLSIQTAVDRNPEHLHPVMRGKVLEVIRELHIIDPARRWALFEGYRHPARQLHVLNSGASKAPPWDSAHQYGLAADIVPCTTGPGKWNWTDGPHWDYLAQAAARHGLTVPIAWDKAHVQHPLFLSVKRLL